LGDVYENSLSALAYLLSALTCLLDGQPITTIPYARAFSQYYIGTQEATGKMYPWLHQQAIEEGLRNLTDTAAEDPACDYMSLTRSTFAGGQRFCSYLWSGDTIAAPATLLQQVTAAVSAAASGISSWTLDIGGFYGLDVEDPDVITSSNPFVNHRV
jgi:alpha-D-xyloside xylohydrolase